MLCERKRFRSEGISILRGIMCLYVVFTHAVSWADYCEAAYRSAMLSAFNSAITRFFQPFGETNAGVIVFIVLSGYCIHRNGLRDTRKANVWNFYFRRAIRILPLFFFAILVGAVLWHYSGNMQVTEAMTATTRLSLRRILLKASTLNAVIPSLHSAAFVGNVALVTVSAEIWFYIAYPLLILLLKRHGDRVIYIGMSVSLAFTALCILFVPSIYAWNQNASALSLLVFWLIGVAGVNGNFADFVCKRKGYFAIAYGLATATQYGLYKLLGHSQALLLLSELRKTLFACMVIVILRWIDRPSQEKRIHPIGWIGECSYSIYATHGPVCIWLYSHQASFPVAIAGCLCFGVVVYYLIEKPTGMLCRKIQSVA